MRKISRYIIIACIYAIVYMVLVEKFSWLNFGIGLAFSFIAFVFSNRYLIFSRYDVLFPVKFTGLIIYLISLMVNIMSSGLKAAKMTVKGEGKLKYEWYTSSLNNDFALNLLANSITLTPGTVTASRKDNDLLIMQLCKEDDGIDFEDIKKFESKIKKISLSEREQNDI